MSKLRLMSLLVMIKWRLLLHTEVTSFNEDITSMCTDACKGKVCEVTRFFRSVAGDELMKLKLGVPRSRTGTGLMVLGGGPGLQSF